MSNPDSPTLATALEAARDHIYEAFELLADRADVPDDVVDSIHDAFRAVRNLEVATRQDNKEIE